MVAEVVVGVVDGHGERDASPQCCEVVVGGGGDVGDLGREVEVVAGAVTLAVPASDQGHRTDVRSDAK